MARLLRPSGCLQKIPLGTRSDGINFWMTDGEVPEGDRPATVVTG